MTGIAETGDQPSDWVRRFAPLIRTGGLVLDLAAGNGRHSRLVFEAFARLTAIAFEQGEVTMPRPAVVQRIAAVAGSLGRLPQAVGLDSSSPTD